MSSSSLLGNLDVRWGVSHSAMVNIMAAVRVVKIWRIVDGTIVECESLRREGVAFI